MNKKCLLLTTLVLASCSHNQLPANNGFNPEAEETTSLSRKVGISVQQVEPAAAPASNRSQKINFLRKKFFVAGAVIMTLVGTFSGSYWLRPKVAAKLAEHEALIASDKQNNPKTWSDHFHKSEFSHRDGGTDFYKVWCENDPDVTPITMAMQCFGPSECPRRLRLENPRQFWHLTQIVVGAPANLMDKAFRRVAKP